MRGLEIGKKIQRVVMYKILTIKSMQLLVYIWGKTETNGKQQLDNPNLDRQYAVTHCQLSPYEFHWPTSQARDNAISANSLVTWLFSKEQVSGSAQLLQKIILYDTEWKLYTSSLWCHRINLPRPLHRPPPSRCCRVLQYLLNKYRWYCRELPLNQLLVTFKTHGFLG